MSSLKNLSFRADRPYGGTSNEPYIKNPIYSNDLTGISNAVTHTVTDVLRMSKFLLDVPKGPLFVAKQIGLQLTNPQMEHKADFVTNKNTSRPTTGQGFFGNVGNRAANTGASIQNAANQLQNKIGSNRIWSPINFMAQIAGSAAGKHIPRHGFSFDVPDSDKAWYITKENNKGQGSPNNRLVIQVQSAMVPKHAAEGKREMFKYTGGPNSFLGIGSTSINSYYSVFAPTDTSNPEVVTSLNKFIPMAPLDVLNISDGKITTSVDEFSGNRTTVDLRNTDFRAYKGIKDVRITDYTKYNTSTRIGVINTNAKNGPTVKNDAVNMVSLYYADSPASNVQDINDRGVGKDKIRDMVKFRIKALDNDKPGFGVYMIFRAFLNNISDNMEATWNPIKYTGRGESFYGYEGFTSTYSVSFTIAAFSKEEMKPLYQKLNYLKSTLTPDYKANKMRGNMMELTVGDYIKYQPGIITSLSVGIPEDAPWEIAMNEPDNTAGNLDKDMHELPQVLKVEFSFTPIYNFLPRKSSHSPFIGIDDSENTSATPSEKEWLSPKANSTFTNR